MRARRARNESVPWRVRLSVAWRDYREDRLAKRHAEEFVGLSPEQAQAHADELGLGLRLGPAGLPVTAEASHGRITGSVRDGLIDKAWVG